jgi:hypothetical protein
MLGAPAGAFRCARRAFKSLMKRTRYPTPRHIFCGEADPRDANLDYAPGTLVGKVANLEAAYDQLPSGLAATCASLIIGGLVTNVMD